MTFEQVEIKEVKLVHIDTVDFGFIYNDKKQQQLFTHILNQFNQLSNEHNIKIVVFTLENLNLDGPVISGTIIEGGRIRQGLCEIPPFIYNLALHSTANKIEKMRSLRKMENTLIINPINRFIQGIIFEMLTSLTVLQPFLLPAVSLNTTTLIDYLNKYDTVFLLPEKSFHPPKAIIIKKLQNNDYMIYIGQNGQRCKKDDIVHYIKKMINKKKHILLKGIECFKNGDHPLEVKVYLQKNINGEWAITAATAKHGIFSRNEFPFSIIRYPFDNLYSNEIKENEKQLASVSIQIGKFLDYYIPFVGSVTFDFIFDETRCPYLIYVSGFEQDQNIFQHMDSKTQRNLLNNAFYYLLYLMNNSVTEKGAQHELDKS